MKRRLLILFCTTGLFLGLWLMFREYTLPGYCPAMRNIPSGYLYVDALLLIAISCVLRSGFISMLLFSSGVTLGLLTAYRFCSMHFQNYSYSPVIAGLPVCLLFGMLFAVMLILRMFSRRSDEDG